MEERAEYANANGRKITVTVETHGDGAVTHDVVDGDGEHFAFNTLEELAAFIGINGYKLQVPATE